MSWFTLIMLGNAFWSCSDVVASIVMNRFEKSGVMVSWLFSALQIVIMFVLYFVLPVQNVWIPIFMTSGFLSYLATLAFFRLLQLVDVSVSSVAWVFLSLGIAVGGMFLFGDTWTATQLVGAVLCVTGTLVLALWHKRVDRIETVAFILLTGLLYVPSFLVQKAAFLSGISVVTVIFWHILFFNVYSLCFPLLHSAKRHQLRTFIGTIRPLLVGVILLWILLSMIGVYLVSSAYKIGDASLVGIAENGQPFFLMLFAWIALLIAPRYAPKEIITAQSTGVKIVTFIIVFVGLGLLAK